VLRNLRRATRPAPTVTLRMEDTTVPGVARSYRYVLPNLDPKAGLEVDVAVECPARGRYRIGEVAVEGTDPLGMFHRPRRFSATQTFLALPRTYSAPGIAAWELLSPAGRRLTQARRREAGDFGGIREYAPGDDLRYVHWKATAHTGHLAIKEFEQRQEAQVAIWLDLSAAGAAASTEIAVSLAASLLQVFVTADYIVQLMGEGLSRSLGLPSRGEAYLGRAFEALAEVQAQGRQPFSATLMELVRTAGRTQGAFAITSGADPGLPDALAFCRTHGITPVVFVVRPTEEAAAAEAVAQLYRRIGTAAVTVTAMDRIAAAVREAAAIGEQQMVT
jgi:uncharacterized protein (DUF58 family)